MSFDPFQEPVISNAEQITTAWLTAALLRCGALAGGTVESFELLGGRGNWSTSAILRLRYSPGSSGSLPPSLFLKMVAVDLEGESFGPSEVLYYTRNYVDVLDAPLVRCYHAAYSETENRYHLLLDDLSATHIASANKAPTLEYGLALAEGLAILHARWWGAKALAEAGAPVHSAEHIQNFVDIAAPGVGHILPRFSAELQPHWPELVRQLFARHPQAIITRSQDLNGFTLIHGDAGEYNILVPRHADRPVYLIDRQPFNWSLTTWLGAYDLAYAMVLDWDVETRRSLEIPVLQHYLDTLIQRGITGYTWERLFDDYRLCVAMGVYIATEYCRGGVYEHLIQYWLPMLQRALTACDDLACSELW